MQQYECCKEKICEGSLVQLLFVTHVQLHVKTVNELH